MSEAQLFIPGFCTELVAIEQETRRQLGDQASEHFLTLAADSLAINLAIMGHYATSEQLNLVYHASWGMLRELKWLHFLFLGGNYPLVKSRLRYVWEATFRAYFVETLAEPSVRAMNPDDKIAWLENHKPRLDWTNCILPTLSFLYPQAATKPDVQEHYRSLWSELNQYIHPSEYILRRMVDASSLHVKDGFDAAWAQDTIRASTDVFDLIWLAVLRFRDRAIDQVATDKLDGKYPILDLLLTTVRRETANASEAATGTGMAQRQV